MLQYGASMKPLLLPWIRSFIQSTNINICCNNSSALGDGYTVVSTTPSPYPPGAYSLGEEAGAKQITRQIFSTASIRLNSETQASKKYIFYSSVSNFFPSSWQKQTICKNG